VGDDTCLRTLSTHLDQQQTLLPHTRAWVQSLIDGINERWRKVTREWPDPWEYWEGRLEAGMGVLMVPGREPIIVRYSLWLNFSRSLDGKSAWGGTLWAEKGRLEPGMEGVLELSDHRVGAISLSEFQVPNRICIVQGKGPYPENAL